MRKIKENIEKRSSKINFNMKKMRKKADISSGWLVLVILLVIGFVILLFFLFRFSWTEQIDKEVCHESVVFRGTASEISNLAEDYIPLKCKTAKYCITSGLIGGKCDKTGEAFSGEKEITKVKVSNKEQIEKFIAGEIINCWSMMGEGKISLFTQYMAKNFGLGEIVSSCVICNRIALDSETLEKAGIDFKSIDVLTYMQNHKAPDKDFSYLDYIAGEKGKISINADMGVSDVENALSNFPKINQDTKDKTKIIFDNQQKESIEAEEAKDENSELEFSVMFMQIIAPRGSDVLKNTAYAALGTGGTAAVFAPIKTIKVIASATFWKITLPVAAIFAIGQQINVAINRNIAAVKCGDISVGKEAKEGCSVVRTVNYNLEELGQYCSVIESIP